MPEVTFLSETFAVPDRMAALPVMRFADAAMRGADTDTFEGQAAMYALLKSCFTEQDWERFEDIATRERATSDDLWAVVQEVFAAAAGRPTGRPSDSSDGPALTSESFAGDSSSRVVGRLEGQGRPDLALLVLKTQESLAG